MIRKKVFCVIIYSVNPPKFQMSAIPRFQYQPALMHMWYKNFSSKTKKKGFLNTDSLESEKTTVYIFDSLKYC